jgi:hypothetical protein
MFNLPRVVIHEHREQSRVGRTCCPSGARCGSSGAGLIAAAILTGVPARQFARANRSGGRHFLGERARIHRSDLAGGRQTAHAGRPLAERDRGGAPGDLDSVLHTERGDRWLRCLPGVHWAAGSRFVAVATPCCNSALLTVGIGGCPSLTGVGSGRSFIKNTPCHNRQLPDLHSAAARQKRPALSDRHPPPQGRRWT